MEKQLTVDEVADLLRADRRTIIKMIKFGRINAFKLGFGRRSRYLIDPSEIHRLIRNENNDTKQGEKL